MQAKIEGTIPSKYLDLLGLCETLSLTICLLLIHNNFQKETVVTIIYRYLIPSVNIEIQVNKKHIVIKIHYVWGICHVDLTISSKVDLFLLNELCIWRCCDCIVLEAGLGLYSRFWALILLICGLAVVCTSWGGFEGGSGFVMLLPGESVAVPQFDWCVIESSILMRRSTKGYVTKSKA